MSMDKEIGVQGLFGYKLKKTQHALRLQMDKALQILELTTPQYAVLAQAELRPGISNAELARLAFITAQTMHSIVTNLEKRDLIRRIGDVKRGRVLATELTELGKQIVTQAHEVIRNVERHMLATLTRDEQNLFEKLLLKCFDNLNRVMYK